MHPRLHVPRRRSAPKAAATADVSHLVEQGLVQSLGVFIDTLVICSATAFVILFDRSCTFRTREAHEEASPFYRLLVGPRKLGQRQAYVSERCSGLMAMWRSWWLPFRSLKQMPYC